MNSFMITERNKNQWIYQWICDIQIIWKLSYINLLRIIVWTLNYVDCIFDPGCDWKGPMNQGLFVLPSFCPFVLLSRSFLGNGSLVFSETQHGVRGPCVVCDRARFFEKKSCPKNGENGQKKGFLKFIGKFSY